MNLLFLSISDRTELYSLTFPNIQSYCDKYGYKFHKIFHSLDNDRHISWSKIPFLIQQMKLYPDYEFYVWIDDDMLITNFEINIIDIIKSYNFDNILVSKDPAPEYPMNCGLLVVKNNKNSTKLLNKIYDLVEETGTKFEREWEQNAFIRYYTQYMDKDIKDIITAEYKDLQSFYRDNNLSKKDRWQRGDFIAHFTGMTLDNRLKYLHKFL